MRGKGTTYMSDKDGAEKDHGNDKTVTIIVNARPKTVPKGKITFEDVVALADGLPKGPQVLYTVLYRKGEDKKPQGSLVAGGDVNVKDGMIFDVSATDQS
jgi:hypothetical protein